MCIHGTEDPNVVLQIPGYEEVSALMLSPLLTQLIGSVWALAQVKHPLGTFLMAIYEVARILMNDLQGGYASGSTSRHGT